MQHIVIITSSYPSTENGSEAAGSFVADFAKTLSKHSKVTVIAPSLTTSTEKPSPHLSIERFKVPCLPLSLLKFYKPKDCFTIFRILRQGNISLTQIVQQQTVDHIFALWVLPSGYWAKAMKVKYGIPYSTWALGSDIWSLGKIPIVKTLLKQVLKHSHRNFADGYLLQQSVKSLANCDCQFLPSTRCLNITTAKQLSPHPPYRLAFLGRWHPNKGIDLLMQSLQQLRPNDWQLIQEIKICGGGPLEATVKSTIAKLQSQQRPITLQGYLNKAQASQLFLWADYVLIPSRIESIPVVFSDAMKCLCPVVSMPVGDLPRLIQTYHVGILAQQVSATAFCQAIEQILNHTPQDFATGLNQATNDFSLEHIVPQFLSHIGTD